MNDYLVKVTNTGATAITAANAGAALPTRGSSAYFKLGDSVRYVETNSSGTITGYVATGKTGATIVANLRVEVGTLTDGGYFRSILSN